VWEQPDCQEFEQQFLCHEMPVVVGVASLKRQLFELTRERATVSERLEQLLEDKHNNNLMPCELYRLYKRVEAQFSTQISSLTARNVELSSELTTLSSKFDDVVSALSARNAALETQVEKLTLACRKQLATADAEAEAVVARGFERYCTMTVLSAPDDTHWDAQNKVLTYTGKEAHNYAISAHRLPSDVVSHWEVVVVSSGGWLCVGIIGTSSRLDSIISDESTSQRRNKSSLSCRSYGHTSSFGWSGSTHVYVNGVNHLGSGGWEGWKDGDRARFIYDPIEQTLALYLYRTNTTFTIDTGVITDAYIHCNVVYSNSQVQFYEVA
jgi:hypothetical protein